MPPAPRPTAVTSDDAGLDALLSRFTNTEASAGLVEGLTLDRIQALCDGLGSPQAELAAVHVTGTNGKGSVARMVASLLGALGLRVGLYTSPHLSSPVERFVLDGEPVAASELLEVLHRVVAAVDDDAPPSQFEVMTAAAFLLFSDHAVDVAVVEVGLLGRYDATNVLDAAVAVLTNLGTDHTDGRPGWRTAIAEEKVGIVKPGSTFVNGCGPEADDIEEVFAAVPAAQQWRRDRDFSCSQAMAAVGGRVLDITTPFDRHDDLFLPVLGAHQADNAAVAVAAAEAFVGGPIPAEPARQGLAEVALPGRFEIVHRDPLVIVDGAHNEEGAAAAAAALDQDILLTGAAILVVGLLGGRDVDAVLRALDVPRAAAVVACTPASPRAVPAAEVAARATVLGAMAESVPRVDDAVDRALALATSDDVILVTGSLYVVGPARAHLLGMVP